MTRIRCRVPKILKWTENLLYIRVHEVGGVCVWLVGNSKREYVLLGLTLWLRFDVVGQPALSEVLTEVVLGFTKTGVPYQAFKQPFTGGSTARNHIPNLVFQLVELQPFLDLLWTHG